MKGAKPDIGIIGGTGGIGRWFADFLKAKGYGVSVSGRKTGMAIPEMAERCPVVIISVPIAVTCDVIREVGPRMKKHSLLADLTSLKAEPVRAMLESAECEVIGLHPLFGPDAASLSGQNIVICPGRGRRWLAWLRALLGEADARLVETTPEHHDEMMALVQGLTHLSTILMGLALRSSGAGLDELMKFSTPNFRSKAALIDRVFHSNPRLYAEILTLNPRMERIVDLCRENLDLLGKAIERKNPAALVELMKI